MTNFEIKRRLIHASGVFIPLLYVSELINWTEVGIILLICFLIVTVLEYLRLYEGFNHIIFEKLTRPYESENIAGYALYIYGMFISWILFPPVAVISGMLMLSIGDPVSGILGNIQREYNIKPLVMTAMFVICYIIVLPLTINEIGLYLGVIAAFIASLGAVIVDEYKPRINGRIIDDNLTIPIISALIISIFTFIA